MEGIIIKNISNDYVVKSNKKTYVCKPRGKFRHQEVTPLVGDHVIFDETNNYILQILPRKNMLIRPSIANVDKAIIVTSVKEPNFNTNLLDKLLIIIEYNNITPIIVLSKLDLLNQEETENIQKYIDYYRHLGYSVIPNTDLISIKKQIKDQIVVFTGQSGSGKSTLLNKLNSHLNLKTNSISKSLGRGKHTTRHTELFKVSEGYVADTPGFSSIDLRNMSNIDIRDNMREMFDNLEYCKYRDCMHLKEDGCKVKDLVKKGVILKSRYENYQKFIERK